MVRECRKSWNTGRPKWVMARSPVNRLWPATRWKWRSQIYWKQDKMWRKYLRATGFLHALHMWIHVDMYFCMDGSYSCLYHKNCRYPIWCNITGRHGRHHTGKEQTYLAYLRVISSATNALGNRGSQQTVARQHRDHGIRAYRQS